MSQTNNNETIILLREMSDKLDAIDSKIDTVAATTIRKGTVAGAVAGGISGGIVATVITLIKSKMGI